MLRTKFEAILALRDQDFDVDVTLADNELVFHTRKLLRQKDSLREAIADLQVTIEKEKVSSWAKAMDECKEFTDTWALDYTVRMPSHMLGQAVCVDRQWFLVKFTSPARICLMAVCAHLRISPQLLEHTQIYRSCVPSCKSAFRWLGPRRAPPSRSNLPLRTPSFKLAGAPIWCSKMPRERDQPALAELPATAAGYPTTLRFAPPCR